MSKEKVRSIGKRMGKSDAKKWVKKYQKENPDGVHGWLFGHEMIEKYLKTKGCEGIWFFKGINDDGEERLVMFPADEDGDIFKKKVRSLGAASANFDEDEDDPTDFAQPCPPHCPNFN